MWWFDWAPNHLIITMKTAPVDHLFCRSVLCLYQKPSCSYEYNFICISSINRISNVTDGRIILVYIRHLFCRFSLWETVDDLSILTPIVNVYSINKLGHIKTRFFCLLRLPSTNQALTGCLSTSWSSNCCLLYILYVCHNRYVSLSIV